jgi:hypothetical protein
MSTKSIVPRGTGEGSLGRADKHWGALYADSCPLADTQITNHTNNSSAHPEGISGNAATTSKFRNAVTINNVPFDGSENINIQFKEAHESFTYEEILNIYNNA